MRDDYFRSDDSPVANSSGYVAARDKALIRKTLAECVSELEYWIAVAEYAKQTILIPYSFRTAAQYHWVIAKQRSWKEAADHFRRMMEE